MVICVERGADLHMAQLMPLPLTVSCSSKIQIGFTFLVPAHPGSPGKRAVKRVCARCVGPTLFLSLSFHNLYQFFCPVKLHYLLFLAYYNGACHVFGHHMLLLVSCYRTVITALEDTTRKFRFHTSLVVLRRLWYGKLSVFHHLRWIATIVPNFVDWCRAWCRGSATRGCGGTTYPPRLRPVPCVGYN